MGKFLEEGCIRSWKHSGFSVGQIVRLETGDQRGVQRLIQYFLRCPFSQARMIEVTEAGKVIYKSDHNQVARFPEAGEEELLAGPSRKFQAQTRSVLLSALEGCSETTFETPHEHFDPTGLTGQLAHDSRLMTASAAAPLSVSGAARY